MIRLKVNGKKYRGFQTWDELTLHKFCDLAAIPMPEGYESYIQADGKFTIDNMEAYVDAVSKLTDKQINEDFPAYYRKVVECLTNIPFSVIRKLTDDQINETYEGYLKPFVLSLIYHVPVTYFMGQIMEFEPAPVKSIRIGLQTFRLPETVNIMGQDIPLAKEPIITYTEASDIFRGMKVSKDDVKNLALFMAIYCRKKGEVYNEKRTLERCELFMQVPTSVVWYVFFYTVRRLTNSSNYTRLFGRRQRSIREAVQVVRDYKSMEVGV